jgi:hypothetical protein
MQHHLTEALAKVWRRLGSARTPVVEDVWQSVRETGGRRGIEEDDAGEPTDRVPRLAPARKAR